MNSVVVSTTPKNQITLTKPIRTLLGFKDGLPKKVRLSVGKNKQLKVEKAPDIFELAGKLSIKRKPMDPVKIREIMGRTYQERK